MRKERRGDLLVQSTHTHTHVVFRQFHVPTCHSARTIILLLPTVFLSQNRAFSPFVIPFFPPSLSSSLQNSSIPLDCFLQIKKRVSSSFAIHITKHIGSIKKSQEHPKNREFSERFSF